MATVTISPPPDPTQDRVVIDLSRDEASRLKRMLGAYENTAVNGGQYGLYYLLTELGITYSGRTDDGMDDDGFVRVID